MGNRRRISRRKFGIAAVGTVLLAALVVTGTLSSARAMTVPLNIYNGHEGLFTGEIVIEELPTRRVQFTIKNTTNPPVFAALPSIQNVYFETGLGDLLDGAPEIIDPLWGGKFSEVNPGTPNKPNSIPNVQWSGTFSQFASDTSSDGDAGVWAGRALTIIYDLAIGVQLGQVIAAVKNPNDNRRIIVNSSVCNTEGCDAVSAVPIPAALPLLASALAAFGLFGWRRKKMT